MRKAARTGRRKALLSRTSGVAAQSLNVIRRPLTQKTRVSLLEPTGRSAALAGNIDREQLAVSRQKRIFDRVTKRLSPTKQR
jgi:hypothetical protein